MYISKNNVSNETSDLSNCGSYTNDFGFKRSKKIDFNIHHQKSMINFGKSQRTTVAHDSYYQNYRLSFQFPDNYLEKHGRQEIYDKLHLKSFMVKVSCEDYMQDVIQELIIDINNIYLKEENLKYELLDDTDLYEIGFSKKNGKMKTDYPTLEHRTKNICQSISQMRLTIQPRDDVIFLKDLSRKSTHLPYTNSLSNRRSDIQVTNIHSFQSKTSNRFRIFNMCQCIQ